MSALYGRTVVVELGPEGGRGTRIEGLRVHFRIEHSSAPEPNRGVVELYNPAPTTIALARAPRSLVRVLAGYNNVERQIGQGEPVRNGVAVRTQGPDRVLRIEFADGGRAYASTLLNLSWSTSTTFAQLVDQVLVATRWARGPITADLSGTLPYGGHFVGRPRELLDRICPLLRPRGAIWHVRDGALVITPRGGSTPESVPLISSASGNLVGSPGPTETGVQLVALLDDSVRPGRRVQLQSRDYSGTFTVTDATFVGDSGFETPFYVEATGTLEAA